MATVLKALETAQMEINHSLTVKMSNQKRAMEDWIGL
jgi:hypothetical protein